MRRNWQYLLLAFVLAVFCWYLVTGREKVESWVPVRVEMAGAPKDLSIVSGMVNSVDVLIRGPKGMIRKLESSPPVYPLNLSRITRGRNTINFDPKAIPLSKVFDVVEIKPSRMELEAARRVAKMVPVKVVLKKSLPPEYVIKKAEAVPDKVRLTGTEAALAGVEDVKTQPLALSGNYDVPFEDKAPLDLPDGVEVNPVDVVVNLVFAVKQVEARLRAPVRCVPPEGLRATFSPRTVTLRVKGPVTVVAAPGFKDDVEALLELSPDLEPGTHQTAYAVRMPQGCELVSAEPENVTVTVATPKTPEEEAAAP